MKSWTFGAVGDVFVNRPDWADAFAGCGDLLRRLDLVFGNCEGAYCDRPDFAPSAGWRVVAPRRCGTGLAAAGFHVMALANNHLLDAGYAGLAQTIEVLHQQGIRTIGAGANLAAAREPVVIQRGVVRIGLVSFASVYQAGYEARTEVPGLSPMRVHSHYYIPDWDAYGKVEPGVPPQVRTIPFPEDLEVLRATIAALRERVDVVVVSHHWGRAGIPAIITDYERTLGRASIDAGADIVLGHHHHFLRAIEIYRDRPIYYGLGHFVFDLPGLDKSLTPLEIEKLQAMGEYAIYPRDGYPLSPFHPDARMTMIAICNFEESRLSCCGFVPALIDGNNHARPLAADTEAWKGVLDYMAKISAVAGIGSDYSTKPLAASGGGYVEVRSTSASHRLEDEAPGALQAPR